MEERFQTKISTIKVMTMTMYRPKHGNLHLLNQILHGTVDQCSSDGKSTLPITGSVGISSFWSTKTVYNQV